jgi:hypothetical protein
MAIKKKLNKKRSASSSKHSKSHQFVQKLVTCHCSLLNNPHSIMALHCCQKGLWNELTLTRKQLPGFEISKNKNTSSSANNPTLKKEQTSPWKTHLCCCTQEWISFNSKFQFIYKVPDYKIYLFVTNYETSTLLKRTEDRAVPPHKWRNQ